jgi:hypothetical protein
MQNFESLVRLGGPGGDPLWASVKPKCYLYLQSFLLLLNDEQLVLLGIFLDLNLVLKKNLQVDLVYLINQNQY